MMLPRQVGGCALAQFMLPEARGAVASVKTQGFKAATFSEAGQNLEKVRFGASLAFARSHDSHRA